MSDQEWKDSKRWEKGLQALKYLRNGIQPYSEYIVEQIHKGILSKIGHISGQICVTCNLRDLKPLHKHHVDLNTGKKCCNWGQKKCNCVIPANKRRCRMRICDKIFEEILKMHASSPPCPKWSNTDITKWTTSPWEIAKCFINAKGYRDKLSAAEMDIKGLLHVLINNLECHQYFPNVKVEVFLKIRERRNLLVHSSTMTFDTSEFIALIKDITSILQAESLKTSKDAIIAVHKLKELQNEVIDIPTLNKADVVEISMTQIPKKTTELKKVIEDEQMPSKNQKQMSTDQEEGTAEFSSELQNVFTRQKQEITPQEETAADENFMQEHQRTQPHLVQERLGIYQIRVMDRHKETVFSDRFQDCCPDKVSSLRNSLGEDVKETDRDILSLQHYGKYLAVLPPLNRVSGEFGVMFKDKYVDLDMQHDLERSEVLNWCRTTKELFPIRTTADGNCLLHAISQGMWGIEDTECLLRRVLYINLVTDAKGMFKKRWMFHQQNSEDFHRVGVQLNTVDCFREWWDLIKATDDLSKSQSHGLPYHALESIHLYVSANMLKRPIIVIADQMARTVFGQTIQDSQISGVYLPLEWSPEQCHKSPIVIGYNMNHFAPLMFGDGTGAGSNDTSIQAVPLVTKAMDSLPIRFLMPNEEMNIRNVLSDYLHTTEVFYNTTTVPAVKVKTHTLPSTLNVLEACVLDCERKFRRLRGEEVPAVIPQNVIMMQPFQFEVSMRAPKPAAPADQRLNDVPQPPARQGSEHNLDLSIMAEDCHAGCGFECSVQTYPYCSEYLDLSLMAEECHGGCGFKCSVRTYPYCLECYPRYNTAQQPRLEPPKQVQSSIMPAKCNNPACKYRCFKATFPYCHACYDQFVAQPNVPLTALLPSLPGIEGPAPNQAPIPGFSAAHTAHALTGRSPQLSNEMYSALQLTHETTASSNNQQQNRKDLGESGMFPFCSPVPVSNEIMKRLNPVDVCSRDNVKCASPYCEKLIYPPKKLCDECATDQEKSKAEKSKKENLRSVGALGQPCNTLGCQLYGLSDFNGYCSFCYKAQGSARVTRPLASRLQLNTLYSSLTSPSQPVSCTVPLAAKPQKGKLCIEKGCTRFGVLSQAYRCSEHYEITMAMFPQISAISIEQALRNVLSSRLPSRNFDVHLSI